MKTLLVCSVTAVLLAPNAILAQIPQSKGTATVSLPAPVPRDPRGTTKGQEPPLPSVTRAARSDALQRAKQNALDRYIAEQEPALARTYESVRSEIATSIDDYLLGTTVLEDVPDPAGSVTIVVRVEVNRLRLLNKLKSEISTVATSHPESLAFVFVAREQQSVTQYDATTIGGLNTATNAKTTSIGRADTTNEVEFRSAEQGKTARTLDASQKEGVAGSSVSLKDSERANESVETKAKATASTSGRAESTQDSTNDSNISVTSSGSTTKKADDVKWRVTGVSEINQVLSGLFADVGFEVFEAEYLELESKGLISVDTIRQDFGSGDDMKPATLRNTAQGVQVAGVPYLVYGTLDVGLRDTDQVSGLARVMVTVNAKAIDVRGRFPRTVSSIGPVQYSGTGPNATAARTNALKLAATEAGKELMAELSSLANRVR